MEWDLGSLCNFGFVKSTSPIPHIYPYSKNGMLSDYQRDSKGINHDKDIPCPYYLQEIYILPIYLDIQLNGSDHDVYLS